MSETFLLSLEVMGLGMLGIFAVALLLMAVIRVLTKLFPGKK